MMVSLVQQAAQVVVGAPTQPDAKVFAPFFFTGIFVVLLQKYLKTLPSYAQFVRAFPGADHWAHWAIAGVVSVIGAAGIHVTWNWSPAAGGSFAGTLPPLVEMLQGVQHFAVDWLKLYATQHWMYLTSNQAPYMPVSK